MSFEHIHSPFGPIGRQCLLQLDLTVHEFLRPDGFGPKDSILTQATFCGVNLPAAHGVMMTSFFRVTGKEMCKCETVIHNHGRTFHVVLFDGLNFFKQELKKWQTYIVPSNVWFAFMSLHSLDTFVCFTTQGKIEHDMD